MSRATSPFRPATVLALLLVGALAFLLLLFAMGKGWTGDDERDGGSHAAANGLNGYSGLVSLAEDTGHEVTLSRNPSANNDYGLLILTPPLWSDAEEINEIIQNRRDNASGPTILILPKWVAFPAQETPEVEVPSGWVNLYAATIPQWFAELEIGQGAELSVGQTDGWQGLALSGDLPDEEQVMAMTTQPDIELRAMVVDDEGDVLVAQIDPKNDTSGDDYYYDDYEPWPVIVVFEPDLMNNYGMADRDRAQLAMDLITIASEDSYIPVRFDLTLNGLGESQNLLTLAFEPPFLAATLCLILAAIVIAWRAFRRFGPPVAEEPAMAQGKRQLARNGASLLERVRRWHLLKQPYEDMIGRRVAAALGLKIADHGTREAAIDTALAGRGHQGPPFSQLAEDLREASGPRDIIRAAQRLRTFERTLQQ